MVRDWFLRLAIVTMAAIAIFDITTGGLVATKNMSILISYFVLDSTIVVYSARQWCDRRESLYKWMFIFFGCFLVTDVYDLLFTLSRG